MKRLLALMVVVAVAVCIGCSKEAPKKTKAPVKDVPPPIAAKPGDTKPADVAPPAEKKDAPPSAEKKDAPPAENKEAAPPAEKKDAPPPAPPEEKKDEKK